MDNFKCADPIIAEAVRNIFIEVISRHRSLKLVREGQSDLVIEGTATQGHAASSDARLSAGPKWAAGRASGVGGDYVSGVTCIALHHGEVLESASWGQVLEKGSKLLPPEDVARNAAERLLDTLGRELRARYNDIVWCGLDFSKVKLIGHHEFARTNHAFPALLATWNKLFVEDLLPDLNETSWSLKSDLNAVQANNQQITNPEIEPSPNASEKALSANRITESAIAELVRSYALTSASGTGMVFVMDCFAEDQAAGCLYVVLFDIASRKVMYSERYCEKASGSGYEAHWFSPIQSTARHLR